MTYQSLLGNIAGKEQLINLQIRSLHGNLLYYKKLNSRPFLANVHDKVLKQTFRPLFFRHFKVFVCDTLHDLVLLVQFRKCEKHPWRNITFTKVAGFSIPPSVCFTFLNCINGTKLCKVPQTWLTRIFMKNLTICQVLPWLLPLRFPPEKINKQIKKEPYPKLPKVKHLLEVYSKKTLYQWASEQATRRNNKHIFGK